MPEILTNQVGPEKQFYDFLSDGKIKIQRNKNTGEFFFHPRVAFPGTGERELEWVEISGKVLFIVQVVIEDYLKKVVILICQL